MICLVSFNQTDRLKRILSSGGDELRKGSNVTDELMDKLVGDVNNTLLGYYDRVLAGEKEEEEEEEKKKEKKKKKVEKK